MNGMGTIWNKNKFMIYFPEIALAFLFIIFINLGESKRTMGLQIPNNNFLIYLFLNCI